MELVTADEMRALDRAAIQDRKIPSLRLMEHAGKAVVDVMERTFGPLRKKTVTVVAGKGQNGGDGFVIARLLRQRGCTVHVALLASSSALKGDAVITLRKYRAAGGRCSEIHDDEECSTTLMTMLMKSEFVVDAILGTGLNAPIQGIVATAISLINSLGCRVIAVDLPSGLDADTGTVLGTAVHADVTVTLAKPKRGLYLGVGPNLAGTIHVTDIGIPQDLVETANIKLTLLEKATLHQLLSTRHRTAHKGLFGHAGIIAGSVGKTGAAAMAAMGALRVGTGLVTVAIPQSLNSILEAKLLEVMTLPVAETETQTFSNKSKESLLAFAAERTAVGIGPGIGQHPDTSPLIQELIAEIKHPMVLDADGINALKGHASLLDRAGAPLIITPHPGEMARLLGMTTADVQNNRLDIASRVAHAHHVYVVLKGAGTVLASPTGRLAINPTGNPGMASGGTGDVLTGMIVGFLAQGLAPWDAACLGTYLHGLAGDLAAATQGEAGLIARDVLDAIPHAIKQLLGQDTAPA